MITYNLRRLLCCEVSTDCFNKVAFRIHQIEVNTMIHQIVLSGLELRWSREIYSILLASILYLIILSCQAYNIIMKLLEVWFQYCRLVASRIAGYHNWEKNIATIRFDSINHVGHLIKFIGTYIGAVCETEIYQRIFPFEILTCEWQAIVIYEIERTANLWLPNPFCLLRDLLPL